MNATPRDARLMVAEYCLRRDLSTDDPYDVWKTQLGMRVKDLFNRNRFAGALPAGALACADFFVNNRLRLFYTRQEYPIVRAQAALALLKCYDILGDGELLQRAAEHLEWLRIHSCSRFAGESWGLGFRWPATRTTVYEADTPLTTVTPYALEAFVAFTKATGDRRFVLDVMNVYEFFEREVKTILKTNDYVAVSYGPFEDRVVTNASSYAMFSYSMVLDFIAEPEREAVRDKVSKLFRFLVATQRDDRLWWYSQDPHSFVDCFHTCIVLKNIVKANRLFPLPGADEIVRTGYDAMKRTMFDDRVQLFRRFAIPNKPSLVAYDLYDNAEALNLAVLLEDWSLADDLHHAIERRFCAGDDVYSQIDVLGIRRNRNMLRWAVMPYVHALASLLGARQLA